MTFSIDRARLLLVAGVAVVALGVAAWLVVRETEPPSPTALLALEIDAETGRLAIPPRTVELTCEKAIRFRKAIAQGDYAAARSLATEILGSSRIEGWRYFPFATFMDDVTDVGDPAYAAHLDTWVGTSGKDALPRLVRAR